MGSENMMLVRLLQIGAQDLTVEEQKEEQDKLRFKLDDKNEGEKVTQKFGNLEL